MGVVGREEVAEGLYLVIARVGIAVGMRVLEADLEIHGGRDLVANPDGVGHRVDVVVGTANLPLYLTGLEGNLKRVINP